MPESKPGIAAVLIAAAILFLSGRAGAQPPGGPGPAEGPFRHKILSATSGDGLAWTRDPGIRLEHASVPCAVAAGGRVYLYYVDANRGPGKPESIACATSADGLRFEKQPFVIEGMTARKALDPSVLRGPDGRFRLYYLASDARGDPAAETQDHRIHLAVSDDGIRFREVGPAWIYPRLVDPDVFLFQNTWYMYVFGGRGTLIATSADGLRFEYRQVLDLPGWGTVAPVALDDGRLRLYAFEQRRPRGNVVRSFLSDNARDWAPEPGDRLVAGQDEQITDPFVIPWRGGYKMYFKASEPRLRPAAAGPWNHDLLVHRVTPDGRVERLATFPRGGVPTVTRLRDGRLIAAYQYFPENDPPNFDKVAVRFSSSEGRNWTPPRVIQLDGLPEGMRFPFDPTLVALEEGRIRLYFTSLRGRRFEEDTPAIYSAISDDGIRYTFEPGVRFSIPGRRVIDCAAVVHQGVFHLYAPDNSAAEGRSGMGYHATSRDGLNFVRAADVRIEGGRRWLGNVSSDGRIMTFVGTGEPAPPDGRGPGSLRPAGGIWFATSGDGQEWKLLDTPPVPGADPGAVRTRDGGWIVISTGPPRPGATGAGGGQVGPPPEAAPVGHGPWNRRVMPAASKSGLD